ncbi:MAG: hypothetical protein IJA62_05835 [Ruminococcus sp.]|nr:hypothetical protein [Ruminococcus sp.]
MTNIFLHLVNMSITAGWIVLAVMLLRLLLRKAPRWIHCLLWGLVGLRLLLPVSIESVLSLIPSKETIPQDIIYSPAPQLQSGIQIFNNTVNPIISESLAPDPAASVNPVQVILGIASYVWLAGIVLMLLYTLVSYLRLKSKVKVSLPVQEGVYICDQINTPFILGIIRPKIYLPSTLSEEDLTYVLAHENAHIKRKDYLWKPLGFLLLSIYWFNPLLWVGYILLCRDIELACDEKVLTGGEGVSKKEYSTALLHCSVPRKMISACPLAFGEVGVKHRIKTILNYKKPAFWIICVALIASIVASVCLLTNPVTEDEKKLNPNVISADSDIEGVSLEIVDLNLEETSTSVPYIEIKWKNENDESYTCGEPFFMYKKVDGEWVDLRRGKSVFTAIGYTIPKHGEFTHKYSLWNMEIDEPGEYRFTSHFLRDKGDTSPIRHNARIDFEVTEIPNAKDYSFAMVEQGNSRAADISLDVVRVHTSTDDPFIEICWRNNTDHDFTIQNEYKLYKHKGGTLWEELDGIHSWEDTGDIVPANDICTKKYSLEDFDIGGILENGKYRFEGFFSSAGDSAWVDFYYPLTRPTVTDSYVSSDLGGLSVEVQSLIQELQPGEDYLNDNSAIRIMWRNQSGQTLTTTSDSFAELYKNVKGIWVDTTVVKKQIFTSDTDHQVIKAQEIENNAGLAIRHSLFGKRYLEDGEYKLTATFVTESGSIYLADVYFTVGKITTATNIEAEPEHVDYFCSDAQESISGTRPQLRLYPTEERFELMLSSLSSYLPTGTYRYEDDKLILEADYGNKYVFRINEGGSDNTLADEDGNYFSIMTNSFSFIAEESTELPKYQYKNNEKAKYPFEDGAVFEIDDETLSTGAHTNYIYDSIYYDIDADGVNEELLLTLGPTYGAFSMSLVVKENGKAQSTTTFDDCFGIDKFEEKDGKLFLTSGEILDGEERFIEVTYDNGIVLRENGFIFGSTFDYPTEQAANVINGYIEGFKTHDVELINSFLHEDLRFDPEDTDTVNALVNTVEDCKLVSADQEYSNLLRMTVEVTYEITYNDNYIPTGNRDKGKNRITSTFTIESTDGKYLITEISNETVQKED